MAKINTETTISVSADDIANILKEYFNVPNAKVNFVLGSKSSPSADFRDCQFVKVLSSAELTYNNTVNAGFNSNIKSLSVPDNLRHDIISER